MRAKEWLGQIYTLKRKIDFLKCRYETLKGMLYSSQKFSADYVSRNPNYRRNEEIMADMSDTTEKIKKSESRLSEIIKQACEKINKMENDEYAILLKLRYIDGLKWEAISNVMNLSLRTIYYIHGSALNAFENK